MPLHIISVGQKHTPWCAFVEDYLKKLKHFSKINHIELPLSTQHKQKSKTAANQAKQQEAKKIMRALSPDAYVVALDERGKQYTSLQLSEQLSQWLVHQPALTFVIGGPQGLDTTIQQRANQQWSLSKLTFPHHLVKLLLVEQLYRAFSLLNNHPYHRE